MLLPSGVNGLTDAEWWRRRCGATILLAGVLELDYRQQILLWISKHQLIFALIGKLTTQPE